MPQAWTIYRTGTERFTITAAHPYHVPVGRIDHTGAGTYTPGDDPQCPRCRQEHTEALREASAEDLTSDTCPHCGRLGTGEPCNPFCGARHQHTQACYDYQGLLRCGRVAGVDDG